VTLQWNPHLRQCQNLKTGTLLLSVTDEQSCMVGRALQNETCNRESIDYPECQCEKYYDFSYQEIPSDYCKSLVYPDEDGPICVDEDVCCQTEWRYEDIP